MERLNRCHKFQFSFQSSTSSSSEFGSGSGSRRLAERVMADVHAAAADEAQVAVVLVESVAERRTHKRALLELAVMRSAATRKARNVYVAK